MTNDDSECIRRNVLKRTGGAIVGAAGLYGVAGSGSASEADDADQAGQLITTGTRETKPEIETDGATTMETCYSGQAPCSWRKVDQPEAQVGGGKVLLVLATDYWYDQNPIACYGEGRDWFEFENTAVSAGAYNGAEDEVESVEVTTELTLEGSGVTVTWPPVFEHTTETTATISDEFELTDQNPTGYQNINTIDTKTDCEWTNQDNISGGTVQTVATFDLSNWTETLIAETDVGGL